MNGSAPPVLPSALRRRALEVCREVVRRLSEPARLSEATRRTVEQSAFPEVARWRPFSLASGDVGLALLFGSLHLVFPEEAWDRAAHARLAAATQSLETTPRVGTGLYSGLTGLAWVTHRLSAGGTRYRRLLASLDPLVTEAVHHELRHLSTLQEGVPPSTFDVVSGLAGQLVCLLERADHPRLGPVARAGLTALIELAVAPGHLPRWHTPFRYLTPDERPTAPYGQLNLGLAHGAPGLLAALAVAHLGGLRVPRLEEAIRALGEVILSSHSTDAWGRNWPYALALDEAFRPGPASSLRGARAGWCYGSPGVARSLMLAGRALGRAEWQRQAVEAIQAVIDRPDPERFIPSTTLCHGLAGLLQILVRFHLETGDERIRAEAVRVTEQLLARFEPDGLLGYRHEENDGRRVDDPGLLDGATGVALALLSTASPSAADWDRLLLIA